MYLYLINTQEEAEEEGGPSLPAPFTEDDRKKRFVYFNKFRLINSYSIPKVPPSAIS